MLSVHYEIRLYRFPIDFFHFHRCGNAFHRRNFWTGAGSGQQYLYCRNHQFSGKFSDNPGRVPDGHEGRRRCLRRQAGSKRITHDLFHSPGGSNYERAADIAADASGNAYIVGFHSIRGFPHNARRFSETMQKHYCTWLLRFRPAFVTKLNANWHAGDLFHSLRRQRW